MTKKKGIIKSFFGSLIDMRKWGNFDEVGDNAKFISRTFKELLHGKQPEADKKSNNQQETFAAMVQRLQWSEEAIKARTKYFAWTSMIYMCAGLVLLFYCGYLVCHSNRLLAIIACLVLGALMLAYAVREFCWYVQMKQRKLGFNLQDVMGVVFKRVK